MASTPVPQGREYFDLVKSIGESKSKQEEDRIVLEELEFLKRAIPAASSANRRRLKELVVRAFYIEMLGQDASFAYIKAVELCAATSISQKKAGYLAASLCFSPDHEFRFMLVNQIQRDMKSSNMLEVCAALGAVCRLVTVDMVPAVMGDVLGVLNHESDMVRKRAVSALHRFHQLDHSSLEDHLERIRRMVCDRDPSVMAATLPLFYDLAIEDPTPFKDLVASFVSILKQIIDHRLPREYDYHRIPAPWVQMSLLRLLAVLGRGDQAASEGMYEVISEAMKRADTGINVGYAIVYECVNTVTAIYPNKVLLDCAASSISRFVRSDSHNLKYIGIKGLAAIVKDHPQYAADHQLAVIDCLEDPDETLKRKTLDLLFRMTNAVNVEFIAEKLITFLEGATDDHFRAALVDQLSQCAERFAPSNHWYVRTIVRVFQLAGDKVKPAVAQTLLQLIADGADEAGDDEDDEEALDDALRLEAVHHFVELIDKPTLPTILAQTAAWVLGEYGYLSSDFTIEDIMDKLCALMNNAREPAIKSVCVTAVTKLIAQHGGCPSRVASTLQKFSQSRYLDVQQRCLEALALLRHPDSMVEVLPVDASCEDIEVDGNLEFLNQYVSAALANGARRYELPPSMVAEAAAEAAASGHSSGLITTPYQTPKIPVATTGAFQLPSASTAGPTPLGPALTNPTLNVGSVLQSNNLIRSAGSANVWGRKMEPIPEPVVATAPTPASPTPTIPEVATAVAPVATLNAATGAPGMWGSSSVSSTVSPAATPVVPELPPAPRELTEKEKMAAALFGGVGKATTAGVGAKRRTTSTASTPVAAPSTPSAPVAPPTPTAAANSFDLFSGMSMPAPPVPSSPAAPTPSMGDGLLDLDSMSTALPPPVPPVPMEPITPLALTTSEYGQRWGSIPAQLSVSVPVRWTEMSLPKLCAVMPAAFHHVESIIATSEAIFSATFTETGAVILAHIKLVPARSSVDVLVKSSTQAICHQSIEMIGSRLVTANM